MIISLFNHYGKLDKFYTYVFLTATIAAVFSCICLADPAFDDFVRNRLLEYEEDAYALRVTTRGFGIASALTSGYAGTLAIVLSIGLLNNRSNKWFYFVIPLWRHLELFYMRY